MAQVVMADRAEAAAEAQTASLDADGAAAGKVSTATN